MKRATEVVDVFHRLQQKGHGLKLLLVGDGPDRTSAEHRARELGVYDDVRFLGKQEPVEEILSIADIFMMPSGSETFGLAALEAMSCGVPVIASRIGGLPELVIDGETGFLCELGDIDGYTEAADRLLSNSDLHERMASASRARAVEEFDTSIIVPRYESYYAQVMERTPLSV